MSIYIDGDIRPGVGGYRYIIVMADGTVTDIQGKPIGKATQLHSHGRLIDADAAIEDIRCEILERQLNGMKGTPFYIEDLRTMWQRLEDEDITPTIIPAEGGADNG